MSDRAEPSRRSVMRGVALGLGASLCWGLYNVGVDLGHKTGFTASDLTALRYGVAALLLAPVLLFRRAARVQPGRLLLLAALVGPAFALTLNMGFSMAPLAHAVVIAPGLSMLTANIAERATGGAPFTSNRVVGIGLLLVGLLIIALDQPASRHPGGSVLLGDLCFAIAGSLWGLFTFLMGRWQMPPVYTTAAIAWISSIVFLPVYLGSGHVSSMPATAWMEQALYQGLIGGCLAIIFFAAAVRVLGAGRAALFSALVPPAAVLLAIPISAEIPTHGQWAGVALVSVGLTVSLDIIGRHLQSRSPR